MDPLARHLRLVRRRAGVSTRAAAVEEGVHPTTWNRYVDGERWARPYDGVAIAAWAADHDAATLAAVAAAHDGAVAGETARWLHGHGGRPRRLEVVIPHTRSVRRVAADQATARHRGDGDGAARPRRAGAEDAETRAAEAAAKRADSEARVLLRRCSKVVVRRCRWLAPGDVVLLRGVPVLDPVATSLSLAATAPDQVRGFLVDARFAGQLDLVAVRARVANLPSLRGRHLLTDALDALDGRQPESVFHDRVLSELQRRGYHPATAPVVLDTPHGRPVHPDIALPDWQVSLELDGDRYHRDRDARRRERDRLSSYASSDWAVVIVDHRTWTQYRERVFADVDGAIAAQLRRGIGLGVPLPPHLRLASGG